MVVCACLASRDVDVVRRVGGEHHDRDVVAARAELAEQIDPRLVTEVIVEDADVEGRAIEGCLRLGAGPGALDADVASPSRIQVLGDQLHVDVVVVDHENAKGIGRSLRNAGVGSHEAPVICAQSGRVQDTGGEIRPSLPRAPRGHGCSGA